MKLMVKVLFNGKCFKAKGDDDLENLSRFEAISDMIGSINNMIENIYDSLEGLDDAPPIEYFNLAVSRTVPEPITLCAGSPLNFTETAVKISTGFETIRRIPLKFLFFISGIIVLNISIFLFTRSRRVSPVF